MALVATPIYPTAIAMTPMRLDAQQYAGSSNYFLGFNDCVHAAFNPLRVGGINNNFVGALPFITPSEIYKDIKIMNAAQ